MVCFRFVLWRYLLQFLKCFITLRNSCSLLSVCSLKIFITIRIYLYRHTFHLWFAFGSFFEDIYYNLSVHHIDRDIVVVCFRFVLWRYLLQYRWLKVSRHLVVVCFRFVLWRYLLQLSTIGKHRGYGCGLLSVCSLKIFITIWIIVCKV